MISCEQPGKSLKNNVLNVIMRLADQEHYVVCEVNGVCEVHTSGFSVEGDVLTFMG